MNYDNWRFIFLGMIMAMLLYNSVQWYLYRERIYGLYTAYMLVWVSYFWLRSPGVISQLTYPGWHFIRVTGPMVAYFIYYDFANAFLNLRETRPNLLRLFRYMQAGLIVYALTEVVFCFFTDYWRQPIHELLHTVVRVMLAVLSVYIIARIYQRREPVTRYFISGSAFLVVGGLVAMALTLLSDDYNKVSNVWQVPLAYLQLGIILELVCFSLGLTYRHRREAVKKAVFEQALAREREQRQREQLEAELAVHRLKQEMTEMQMRALQAQISPHFLFNSLNSLSSLITDDPDKAEQFVDEMSSVYRYLLQANERELTTVGTEIGFINSYYHLLKTRYGQGIHLDIAISDTVRERLLPPLTLQLLVENAVKHNIVSADQPLRIRIVTDKAESLTVSNNLQRKPNSKLNSTQKGLLNIAEKYKLLNQPDIAIQETGDTFRVVVPLIARKFSSTE
ncbi:sensor histidine kinase [Nibrella saemangeumensis]|uniref:sensor histidine kinase n=1 Tax=Nibrella saemangeumensis TaxID=1084526 RepID=UPI0031EFFAA9